MLDFKWIRRRDKPNEVVIQLPYGVSAEWLNSDIQTEIIRTVSHAIVDKYAEEIIQDILGKEAFDEAIKEAVVDRIIGRQERPKRWS